MIPDGYFLSSRNPIANTDQRTLEDRGVRILQDPVFAQRRLVIDYLLREVFKHPSAEQMDRFDSFIDEYLAHFAFRFAAADGQYPGVLRLMDPPVRWFGRDVPGTRWGGATPNFTYRVMPVSHGSRYEIRVRSTCARPPTAHYSLMSDNTAAHTEIGVLDNLGLVTEPDGSYTITVDGEPANGRPNHLQTKPGAYQIWVRDAVVDWSTDSPNAIRISLLDAPTRAPLSDAELAAKAVQAAADGIYYNYYVCRLVTAQAPNQVVPPASTGPFGGVSTQFTGRGNIVLADDEAMVLRATSAGAIFRDAVLCDHFMMSISFWDRQTTLNSGQMEADADGLFTYVIAHQDPGVHNWLDTTGLNRLMFGHRWQSFPGGRPSETPTLSGHVVKFRDLDAALPATVRRIDAEGRRNQIARRTEGFARRFLED
jgi:hypothetical protein